MPAAALRCRPCCKGVGPHQALACWGKLLRQQQEHCWCLQAHGKASCFDQKWHELVKLAKEELWSVLKLFNMQEREASK